MIFIFKLELRKLVTRELKTLLCGLNIFHIYFQYGSKTVIAEDFCIYQKEEVLTQTCRPQQGFSFSTDPDYLDSFANLTVPVVFWGVNRDDGSSDDILSKNKIEESLRLLNSAFNQMKIKFVLQEFITINSSEIYWTDYYVLRKYLKNKSLVYEDALNIYVPYRFTNFENNLRGGKWSWNQLGVNMLNYKTGILPHEVGHIFGLNHMHQGFETRNCERVTKDKNDKEYNAHCSGDLVTDTNAMPNMYGQFHLITNKCEYTGALKNCKGERYQLTESDIRNFMSYTQHDCRLKFTTGQGIRAREFILKHSKQNRYQYVLSD